LHPADRAKDRQKVDFAHTSLGVSRPGLAAMSEVLAHPASAERRRCAPVHHPNG
jgi:hypothetical protein